jgi:sugar lactone lactonase YvrE
MTAFASVRILQSAGAHLAWRLFRLGLAIGGSVLGIMAYAQSNYATPYTFTTLAGTPPESADGTRSAARFNGPNGVAVDTTGNVYVADSLNDIIRKITPAGIVTTLAGSAGRWGSADGTGSAARFNSPAGVAVDTAGNVYVADFLNDTIRKITPAGAVTTLAGSPGNMGSADGAGSAAQFDLPNGVAVDNANNVYVSDLGNNAIRTITPGGLVTTFSLDSAPGTTGEGGGPVGVAVDADGNIYVPFNYNQPDGYIPLGIPVFKITPGGTVEPSLGFSSDNRTQFSIVPNGVAVDGAGNVYVTGGPSGGISKITPAGVVTALASAGDFGIDEYLTGVAVDAAGNVFVADTGENEICTISTASLVTTLAGSTYSTSGSSEGPGNVAQFDGPSRVAADNAGNIFVADFLNDTIRKITQAGNVSTLAGTAGGAGTADGLGGAARFYEPSGVAADNAGNVYVSDTGNHTIRKITPAGLVSTLAGSAGNSGSADGTGSSAQFNDPTGLAVDAASNIYVADTGNNTIRKVTPTGIVSTLAGTAGVYGSANGIGSAAQFRVPDDVAVDTGGNVFVADTYNDTIRAISPAGVVSTLAGAVETAGSADGTGSAAKFDVPSGLAVDTAGYIFVADTQNDTIREITPDGVVTTLAGTAGRAGWVDGTGSAAGFDSPGGVALDSAGNLYVADTANNLIRVGALNLPFTSQPQSQTVNSGSSVVFTAAATGAATYQWEFDGNPIVDSPSETASDVISGATGPQLMIGNTSSASAGNYTCVATNSGGTDASSAASLSVTTSSSPGTLIGLSGRGFVGTGDNILIGGFYIVGSTSATVLVQAIGPALAAVPYNVSGTLKHPALAIHQSQNGQDVVLYSNTGWGSSPVLLAAAAAAYAQPVLQPGSADSELLLTLPPGGYTAEVNGADGGTGVALCGIYQLP